MKLPVHLDALRAFEASARHQRFSAAAAERHVTPAAVGQLVHTVEKWLGVESCGPAEPTYFGHRLPGRDDVSEGRDDMRWIVLAGSRGRPDSVQANLLPSPSKCLKIE